MGKVFLLAAVAVVVQSCSGLSLHPFVDSTTSEPAYLHRVSFQGETLGMISRWYTGSEANWREIHSFNPELEERRLRIGSVIYIPESMVTQRTRLPKWYVQKNLVRASSPAPAAVAKKPDPVPSDDSVVTVTSYSVTAPPINSPVEIHSFFPDVDHAGDSEMIQRKDKLLEGLLSH